MALRASVDPSYVEIVLALLVAGVGISMALPTVPTAVLGAVDAQEMGKASGINTMMQRFGAVFGVAIGSAIFSAYGRLGSPAAVTDGFKPALAACAALSLLGAAVALAVGGRARAAAPALAMAEG